jgi:hypothetical protein
MSLKMTNVDDPCSAYSQKQVQSAKYNFYKYFIDFETLCLEAALSPLAFDFNP